MAYDTLPDEQVQRISRKLLLEQDDIPPRLAAAAGCDAYEPAPAGNRRCSALGSRYAYFPYGDLVLEPDDQNQPYGLGGFCTHHLGVGTFLVRRPPAGRARLTLLTAHAGGRF